MANPDEIKELDEILETIKIEANEAYCICKNLYDSLAQSLEEMKGRFGMRTIRVRGALEYAKSLRDASKSLAERVKKI